MHTAEEAEVARRTPIVATSSASLDALYLQADAAQKIPIVTEQTISALHRGDQVTVEGLNGLCWPFTDKGTVMGKKAMPDRRAGPYTGQYVTNLFIRRYRCHKRGWVIQPGDRFRLTPGW